MHLLWKIKCHRFSVYPRLCTMEKEWRSCLLPTLQTDKLIACGQARGPVRDDSALEQQGAAAEWGDTETESRSPHASSIIPITLNPSGFTLTRVETLLFLIDETSTNRCIGPNRSLPAFRQGKPIYSKRTLFCVRTTCYSVMGWTELCPPHPTRSPLKTKKDRLNGA